MHMEQLADDRGFVIGTADGTSEPSSGIRFWAATDACCNFVNSPVDDSGFIRSLIEAIQSGWPIDPQRIYVTGHSNGGFMSYRMACDHADLIAGIASLAGAAFDHAPTSLPHIGSYSCAPSEPVHVLQVHGSSDGTVSYAGGTFYRAYPSAAGSVRRWAAFNGCDDESSPAGNTLGTDVSWDLVAPSGEDTTNAWHDNCPPGGSAELWTIANGQHTPRACAEDDSSHTCSTSVAADSWPRLSARMVDWLLERRKP
jgi:polyhydroxybutyrate depolymerase|eukprot:COSAG06_NODE_1470_length_9353_cov_7.625351_3_plen_255_part_00